MPIFEINPEVANIQEVVGQTLFGASTAVQDSSRVPMAFTSTKRLRTINKNFNSITTNKEEEILKALQGDKDQIPSGATLPVIHMAVNPNSISWRQPKRITKRDTQEGSVFFHFTNARGQNNDILTLDFKGNTGNIDLASDKDSSNDPTIFNSTGQNTNAYKKLQIWHNLYNLTREAMLLDDNTINEFLITYTSSAMPSEIMLIGFFSKVLDWDDVAEKPNSKDYSFSFTVQEIMPDIDTLVEELTTVNIL